jgi:SAM-dependent methyltransferase
MTGELITGGSINLGTICPVCATASPVSEEARGWGNWHRCPACKLEFVEPMALPQSPERLFDEAYRGFRQESRLNQFHDRVAIRSALRKDPELWFWTPAFYRTLEWLEQRYPPGAVVLDLGCGLGFFLHAARKRGFRVEGLDVALRAVELNREDGFRVWHGTLDSMPPDWVQPDAIVAFFMLHHLEDPMGFLHTIHTRWPKAGLAIAQYGPSNRDKLAVPPRDLTRWNAQSLQEALRRVGYEATTAQFPSSGTERGIMKPVRKILKRTLRFPFVYRALRRIERRVMTPVLACMGKDEYVVLAVAESGLKRRSGGR